MNNLWTWWALEEDHYVLELHEDKLSGVGLELQVLGGAGMAPTYGVWRTHDGAIIRIERAGEA